ncbi:MAG: efflux RND transporter periplasmic adaptor subunit [Rhodocyclales bacterium]|nr:efflux RND transporter periplasmic adaptor subunit [Rhodocyclales bacterium]
MVAACVFLAACDRQDEVPPQERPVVVRTAMVRAADPVPLVLSGTVQARYESPLAFQVGGRIVARLVDAGATVRAGQALVRLDPKDVLAQFEAAQAAVRAAQAQWRLAQNELARTERLAAQRFVGEQALDRARTQLEAARSELEAAQAQERQARHALEYAELRAPADGVLVEWSAEPGQVVAAGQPVAMLAQKGEREVEVALPERFGRQPPPRGEALLPDGSAVPLELREVSGAADAVSRTFRARYRLLATEPPPLGSVVQVRLPLPPVEGWEVPVGAIDERGGGARVWRVRQGRLEAVPVDVLALENATARVRGPLEAGEHVVAFGTHVLREGMRVEERAP